MALEKLEIFVIGGSVLFLIVFYVSYFLLSKFNRKRKAKKDETLRQSIETNLKIKNHVTDKQLEEIKKSFLDEKAKDLYHDFSFILHLRKKWLIVLKDFILNRWFVNKILLIDMELTNGFHTTFLVAKKKDNSFKFNGKRFILTDDPELKYYNLSAKCWCLCYHEDFSLPYRKKVNLIKMKNSIISSDRLWVTTACNSLELESYTDSKVTEAMLKGGRILKEIKQFKFFLLALLVVTMVTLFIIVQTSGILKQLNVL